jgi:hypothetical protein
MASAVNALIAAELHIDCRRLIHRPPTKCFGILSYRFSIDRGGKAIISKELPQEEQKNIFAGQKDYVVSFKKGESIEAERMNGFSGNLPRGGHTKKDKPFSGSHSGQTWHVDGGRCVVYITTPWPPGKAINPPQITPYFSVVN